MLDHNFSRPWTPPHTAFTFSRTGVQCKSEGQEVLAQIALNSNSCVCPKPTSTSRQRPQPSRGRGDLCLPQRTTWACPVPGLVSQLTRSGHHPSRSRNAAATRATTFQGGKQTLWAVAGEGRAAAPGLQVRSASPLHPSSPYSLGPRSARFVLTLP